MLCLLALLLEALLVAYRPLTRFQRVSCIRSLRVRSDRCLGRHLTAQRILVVRRRRGHRTLVLLAVRHLLWPSTWTNLSSTKSAFVALRP